MNGKGSQSSLARRLFLARLGKGVSVLGATAVGAPAAAAQSAGDVRWQPVRHAQDDWLDKIPGMHRFVFDTTSPEGFGTALQYAGNYFEANKNGYGLQDTDLTVVIVARHKSTAFAYNDAMWAKYSAQLSAHANNFTDPKTKQPPTVNVYAVPDGRLDPLLKKGVHLAVCQMATRNIAGQIARATGSDTESIIKELVANLATNGHVAGLAGNGHMVPAGIVALNRAQERGYALANAG